MRSKKLIEIAAKFIYYLACIFNLHYLASKNVIILTLAPNSNCSKCSPRAQNLRASPFPSNLRDPQKRWRLTQEHSSSYSFLPDSSLRSAISKSKASASGCWCCVPCSVLRRATYSLCDHLGSQGNTFKFYFREREKK